MDLSTDPGCILVVISQHCSIKETMQRTPQPCFQNRAPALLINSSSPETGAFISMHSDWYTSLQVVSVSNKNIMVCPGAAEAGPELCQLTLHFHQISILMPKQQQFRIISQNLCRQLLHRQNRVSLRATRKIPQSSFAPVSLERTPGPAHFPETPSPCQFVELCANPSWMNVLFHVSPSAAVCALSYATREASAALWSLVICTVNSKVTTRTHTYTRRNSLLQHVMPRSNVGLQDIFNDPGTCARELSTCIHSCVQVSRLCSSLDYHVFLQPYIDKATYFD